MGRPDCRLLYCNDGFVSERRSLCHSIATMGLSAKGEVYVTGYVTVLKAHVTFYTVKKPGWLYGSTFGHKRSCFVSIMEAQRIKKFKKLYI